MRFTRSGGYETGYRTGRSIGVAYLEAPELKAGDETVLQAGMTFAVDGGISIDGVTAGRIGDSIVVTETRRGVSNGISARIAGDGKLMFRLAVAQVDGALGPAARLDWLAEVLAGLEADMLVLPELFACGYNVGDALRARAEPAEGPVAEKVARLAQAHGVAVHYGYAEAADGVVYNAAQCFGPDGARLGHHRKLAIPPGMEEGYFTPGAGCSTFDFKGLRFGMLICYDVEFPEAVRHVAGLGAQVVLAPTALGAQWEWVAQTLVPARGFENGVYLAYANSAGAENGMAFLGQSFIGAPDGVVLARAGGSAEVIVADVDAARVAAAQARLPYLRDREGLISRL